MKDYSNIVSKITSTPWMMLPSALKMMLELVDMHLNGTITEEEIRLRMQGAHQRATPSTLQRTGVVGVLPLHGPIFPKANLMTEMSGATSLEQWRQDFRQLVSDDSISSIVLDVDSPGGSSALIEETSTEIRQARETKPIYAIANTMAASAAYGLAAQATKLFVSPSSMSGNVGTYLVHTDDSGKLQQAGVKETVIKAGRFKAAEFETLTPESREYLQEIVVDLNERFLSSVAAGRNLDPEYVRSLEGRVLGSQRAVSTGMADEIATFEDVLIEAAGGGSQATSIAVARSVSGVPERRQSYDADLEHSEPGTGSPPEPREPPEEGDPAIEGGWRRDSPPIVNEPPEESMNREWLEARANALGIEFTDETTDDELASAVEQRVDEIVVPLNNAIADATQQRTFETEYPEQAAALARLENSNRAQEANLFASSYATFEGQKRGFSPVVREQIAQAHLRISTRQFSHDDLRALLDATASQHASVPQGEGGSSRSEDTTDELTGEVTGDFVKDRKQFAELVRAAMEEDSLSQQAAIQHVSQAHPELAQAYLGGHSR